MPTDVLVADGITLALRPPQEVLGADVEMASLFLVRSGIRGIHVSLHRVAPARWRFVALDPEAHVRADSTCILADEITYGNRLQVGDQILALGQLEGDGPERPQPTLEVLDLLSAFDRLPRTDELATLVKWAGKSLLSLLGARACRFSLTERTSTVKELVFGDRSCLAELLPGHEGALPETGRAVPVERQTLAGGTVQVLTIPLVVPGGLGPDVPNLGHAKLCFDATAPWVDAPREQLATAWGHLVGAELARLSREQSRPGRSPTRAMVRVDSPPARSSALERGPPVEVEVDLRPIVVEAPSDATWRCLESFPEDALGSLPLNRIVIFLAGDEELAKRARYGLIGRRPKAARKGVDSYRDPDPPSQEAEAMVPLATRSGKVQLRIYRSVAHPEIGTPEGGRVQGVVVLPVLNPEGEVLVVIYAESWHGEGRFGSDEVRRLRDLVAKHLDIPRPG